MDQTELDKLTDDLKRHEGYKDKVYLDPLGKPTCGWGHHLWVGSRINEIIANEFLKMDIADIITDFWKIEKKYREKLNGTRRRVIMNMLFNMGLPKVLGFKKMWKCILAEDWPGAKREMLNSTWAIQVGQRAIELSNMMLEG